MSHWCRSRLARRARGLIPRVLAGALAAGFAMAAAGSGNAPASPAQPGGDGPAKVLAAANAFLATLDAGQRAGANIELTSRTRTIWSNLPTGVTMQVGATERNGLKLGDMRPAQEQAALALVASALSRDGFRKVMAIVDADEVLEQRTAPTRPATSRIRFGRREFYLAILGTPSATGTWMLQFGGHHLAVNVTFARGARVLTPTHTGAQPAAYSIEGRSIRPLGDENDKAFALVNSLTPDQRKQALLGVEVRNLVLGPGEDGRMIAPEGVKASTLTAGQRARLVDLVGEWVGIIGEETASAKMAEVDSGLDETWFAWAGPTANGSAAYFRIQGPAVFIEYAPQGSPPSIDHIHTIYRDPANDYAARVMR